MEILPEDRAAWHAWDPDRKYQVVADNTYDWEFWQRPDGGLEYCSPSCQRITGHARDAFLEDPGLLLRVVHPEDLEAFLAHRSRVEASALADAGEFQFRILRPDGSQRWIGHVCQPVFDPAGRFLGTRGSHRDITGQKSAEAALRTSEARYRALFEKMAEGFALHEFVRDSRGVIRDFRFLEVNPAFERILGLKRAEVIGRLASEVMPGEVARWIRRAGSLALDGHSARMEDYVPNARRHFEVSVHAPGPDQLAVLFSDITDRRKARMELQRLVRERTADLARFNQTLKATLACNQAIIRTSSETGLLEECCRLCLAVQGVDRAWVGLAGAEAGRPVRLAAAIGCPGEGWSPERAAWAGADAGPGPTGIAIRTGRVCLRRRGRGDPGGARATLALPLLADQAAFGALVLEAAEATFDPGQVLLLKEVANNLAIGITALRSRSERDQALQTAKRQTEQLRALALELSRTKQRERERLAGVLHDHLQQVLVGATFGIETLAGQVRSRAALDTLDRLAETVQRAMGISRDLTVELSPPVFREKGLAAGLRWLGHQARRDYGLKVELDLEGHLEPGAEAIRLFIFEAVRELLLNVAKHARVDRTRVQARPLGAGAIEIRVEDAGAGFDPASLDGLAFPGAGLGLLGIRERLRALRGALEIVSAPGRGSRFTVVVPVQAAEPAQAGSGG